MLRNGGSESKKMKVDKEKIRELVIAGIDLNDELSDYRLHEIIDEVVGTETEKMYLSLKERWNLHKEIFDSIRGLGVLQELLEDDDITEIMVNDASHIFIEKNGKMTKYDGRFASKERLEDIIQQIVGKSNKRVNQSVPIVDTRLQDGSRVNVVLSPISIGGSAITIRKFPKESITMESLISYQSVTVEAAEFLKELVEAGYNIFISGGTGSGKTTFLNALSNFIPEDERIITIEDSAELKLQKIENIVSLEVRQENVEGENAITIRDLIKTALRMRPSRIIVGEVRGGEALDMLQAMNTGHDGSMSTGHANSPGDMMNRLETMVLMGIDMPLGAIRGQIASGIDIIVHLARMRDKSRRVLEIDEVLGIEEGEIKLNPIFITKKVKGKYQLIKNGNGLQNKNKLDIVGE